MEIVAWPVGRPRNQLFCFSQDEEPHRVAEPLVSPVFLDDLAVDVNMIRIRTQVTKEDRTDVFNRDMMVRRAGLDGELIQSGELKVELR